MTIMLCSLLKMWLVNPPSHLTVFLNGKWYAGKIGKGSGTQLSKNSHYMLGLIRRDVEKRVFFCVISDVDHCG